MLTCMDGAEVPHPTGYRGRSGHSVVLAADSRKPLLEKLWSNRLTLCWSSAMVFPPQYIYRLPVWRRRLLRVGLPVRGTTAL